VASHYYIRHQSMVTFNEMLGPHVNESTCLAMMSMSSEFEQMMLR
jgi:activating signal cointegrator complex subunit 3